MLVFHFSSLFDIIRKASEESIMTKSIRNYVENEIVINKSRFIGLLIPISDVKEVPFYLEMAKSDYPDASHYCYAYCIDAFKKASDDGEPAKTAGMPILNVLEKNELDHILAIVVRYFGGIKLGAGGLVRAYSQSVVEALAKATVVTKVKAPYYSLVFDYHYIRQMDHLLKTARIDIVLKSYDDKVRYECYILDEQWLDMIKEKFSNQIEVKCLKYDDVELKEDIYLE